MRFLLVASFVVVVILESLQGISKIATHPYVYYIDLGKSRLYTEYLEQVYGKTLDRFLYINLKTYHYIDYVDLTSKFYISFHDRL